MAFKLNLAALGNVFGQRATRQQIVAETSEPLGDASLLNMQIPDDQEYIARKKAEQQGLAGYHR